MGSVHGKRERMEVELPCLGNTAFGYYSRPNLDFTLVIEGLLRLASGGTGNPWGG